MPRRAFKIAKNLREEKLVVKVGVVAAAQRLTRYHICFQCSLRHCIVIIRGKQHSTTSIHFCIKRTREKERKKKRERERDQRESKGKRERLEKMNLLQAQKSMVRTRLVYKEEISASKFL